MKSNNRRYYLHKKTRENNTLTLEARKRTLYAEENTIVSDKYALELLKEFNYAIQYEIR